MKFSDSGMLKGKNGRIFSILLRPRPVLPPRSFAIRILLLVMVFGSRSRASALSLSGTRLS